MFGKLKRASKGQGVVEYTGALVIAAAVVLAGLLVAPPSLSNLFTTLYSSVSDTFMGYLTM